MRKRVIPLLLAVCLLLTACGAEKAAETPKFDFQAETASLSELMAEANEARREAVDTPVIEEAILPYVVEDGEAGGLLTAAEVEELKRYPQTTEECLEYAARTVTAEEAKADIDLLFRALRAAYGAYGCFDRAQFDAAEQAALDWADGQKGDIGHRAMAKKLGEVLAFIAEKDSDFRVQYATEWNNLIAAEDISCRYHAAEGYQFQRDEQGYFMSDGTDKWYWTAFGDEGIAMRPTLLEDGRIVYRPTWVCPDGDAAASTVTLEKGRIVYLPTWVRPDGDADASTAMLEKGGESRTFDLVWTGVKQPRETFSDAVLFAQGGGVAYTALHDANDLRQEDAQQAYDWGAAARQGRAAILDLRGLQYGGDSVIVGWMQGFLQTEDWIPSRALFAWRNSGLGWSDDMSPAGTVDVGCSEGRWYENATPLVVLVDDRTGCLGEQAVNMLRQVENVVLVGTNTAGNMLCPSNIQIYLPGSGVCVDFGDQLMLEADGSSIEYRGYEPDIWCDSRDGVSKALTMLTAAGTIGEEDGAALLEAIETAQNANVHLSIDFYGSECREGEGLGASHNSTYKGTVLVNGEKVTDFSAESGDAEVCAVSVKNGQLIFKTRKSGTTDIIVTWQGHTARFAWCTS